MTRLTLTADTRERRPLWRNGSFLLMWTSVAASGFGDRVMMLAAMTLLGATSADVDGTRVLAGVTFFFFLPYLLMSVPGGWLADRLPRKWLMLACDESRAAILLLSFLLVPVAGAAAIPDEHEWKVFAVMACVGVFAALFNPVRNAVVPQIVPLKHLQSANALLIGITVIASLIGLLVGGEMFDPADAGSVRTGLFVGAMFYGVSGTFFAFLRIRGKPSAVRSTSTIPRREPHATPYLLRHRAQIMLIVISMVVWGVAFVVYNAALALAKHRYGFTDEQLVLKAFARLGTALGAGMLAGAIWVAWMNSRRESSSIGMFALLMAAVCTVGLAWSPRYAMALTFAFGVGLFGNTTIICVTTLLQSLSPNYIRGRVMGVNSLTSTTTNVAANLIIWRMPNSDVLVLRTLDVLAALLAVIALAGLWLELTRGPLPTRMGNVFWRLNRMYVLVWHRLRWVGRHHVPSDGPVILAANHTTAIDPMLMQAAINRTVRWMMLESFRFRILAPLWNAIQPIALEKNATDLAKLREVLRVLEDGAVVGLFPEGGLQRENRVLKPFAPGVGLLARRSGAAIVPVWIEGTPRTHRTIWHYLQPSRSTVIFGKPYKPDPRLSNEQVTEDLRRRMLELAQDAAAQSVAPVANPS